MLARHGQRLSSCSLFVLSCQVCSHRQNNVEYFGDWLWITFLDARGTIPWKAIIWCTVTVVPNLTRGCQPYGLIENVVTHAEHRQRGYGKAVLAEALALAWSQGCYKVMLMTL